MEKRKGIFRRIILPILVVVVIFMLIMLKLGSNKEKMEADANITNQKTTVFPVSVIQPTTETITQDFDINGNFIPDHQLDFVSEVSGRVRSLNVENGDYVSQGKTIAVIDNEQVQIDLRLAKATLEKAKSDLEKYESMVKSGAVNKQQVEDMKMQVKSAESNVQSLQRQLRLTNIVAPISGYVSNVSIEKGSFLAPGTPIAKIIDIKTLKLSVKLLDVQVVRVRNGQKVSIVPDLYKNETISGTVASIAPEADGSKKFDTEIKFINPAKTPLKSGMSGKVKFEFGGTKEALTIPIKCLVGSVKNPKVYVIEGNIAKLISIRIGSVDDDKLEIVSGLTPSMKVVRSGQLNLSNGSKISIIQ